MQATNTAGGHHGAYIDRALIRYRSVHHFTCFKAQTQHERAEVRSAISMGARHGLRRGHAASACPFIAFAAAVVLALPGLAAGDTHYYTFNVRTRRA